eukprot:COSAG06_NODE_4406_length_4293_cov_2.302575_5_plen_101_part_00
MEPMMKGSQMPMVPGNEIRAPCTNTQHQQHHTHQHQQGQQHQHSKAQQHCITAQRIIITGEQHKAQSRSRLRWWCLPVCLQYSTVQCGAVQYAPPLRSIP